MLAARVSLLMWSYVNHTGLQPATLRIDWQKYLGLAACGNCASIGRQFAKPVNAHAQDLLSDRGAVLSKGKQPKRSADHIGPSVALLRVAMPALNRSWGRCETIAFKGVSR
jgi:hypothetical protein